MQIYYILWSMYKVIYAYVPHKRKRHCVNSNAYIHKWFLSFVVKSNPHILRNISAVIKFKGFFKNSCELAIYYVHILASLCLVINCGILNS